MTALLNPPRRTWLLLVLALIVAIAIAGLSALVMDGDQSDAERRGALIGAARSSGSAAIVARVNGHPITAADIAEGRARVAANLEWMRDTISRIVPDEEFSRYLSARYEESTPLAPGEVQTFVDPRAPIPESSGLREDYEARIALIEQYGAETAGFAQLVSDLSQFTTAVAAGHCADPADVASHIEEVQATLAQGLNPELEGYLSVFDEEVFFAEVLPNRLAQESTRASWRGALLADVGFEEEQRIWRDAERAAVSAAEVTLAGGPGLDATVEDAVAYLDAYWKLTVPAPSPTPEYLTEEIPPCTPAPGSSADPCSPGGELTGVTGEDAHGSAVAQGSSYILHEGQLDLRYRLRGSSSLHVPHLVLRGTYLPRTVRCTAGDRLRWPSHAPEISPGFLDSRAIKCYVDVRVNAYVLGTGPSTLTVMAAREIYWDGYGGALEPDPENETDPDYVERLRQFHERGLIEGEGSIEGREAVLFIGPAADTSSEAWRVFETWEVRRRNDDVVVAVHPDRDRWVRARPEDYPTHRSKLEMELPAFTQAVTTANHARVAAYGGRTDPHLDYPLLVTDANQLRQLFIDIGAYDHPDGPPAQPPRVPACANGTAVTDPGTNRGLVHDCEALLAAKDTLRCTATLDWSAGRAITSWEGITTSRTPSRVAEVNRWSMTPRRVTKVEPSSRTPSRVTEVNLSSEGLSGSIPPALGTLFELTTLDLSMNALTGEIPAELGWLSNLEELRLSGNSLTGCTPVALRDVATNDLSSLNLSLYCRPPAPDNLSAETLGDASVALSWDAVANASTYRVEYRRFGDWTVDDETITGTAHTVDGLSCGRVYRFQVSAYGSGTVYAAAWSAPTARVVATTSACVPPPPAPVNLSAGAAGENSVALSWSAVGNASRYRVEYRSGGPWTVDDDTITGTSHTVDGLACGSKHLFWVRAYGSGTVYAAAWSEPSVTMVASTSTCAAGRQSK